MTEKINPVTLEILRMAKEIVINEYTDRRAQEHNQWLKDSEELWRTKRVKLPYPDIPPYPTEVEIVKRAQTLFAFLKDNQAEVDDSLVNPPRPKVPEWEKPKPEPVPEPEPPLPPPVEEKIEYNTKEDILKELREKERLLDSLRFNTPMALAKG